MFLRTIDAVAVSLMARRRIMNNASGDLGFTYARVSRTRTQTDTFEPYWYLWHMYLVCIEYRCIRVQKNEYWRIQEVYILTFCSFDTRYFNIQQCSFATRRTPVVGCPRSSFPLSHVFSSALFCSSCKTSLINCKSSSSSRVTVVPQLW